MKKSWKTRPLGYESLERRDMLSASPAPNKLVFTTPPSGTLVGANIAPAVQVSVENAGGTVLTGNTSSVTLALANNPAKGTLGGTLTVAAVNGVATFSNLSLNKAGTGYTLKAVDGSLSAATSGSFNVVPATPSKLIFTTQPSRTVVGVAIAPAVQVSVEDANGNVLTGNTSSVTLVIANNPAKGTLGGTLTVAAVNGVATFSNLSVNTIGTGYSLKALDGSLSATSGSFNVVPVGSPIVVPAAATQLVFTTQPSNSVAGAGIAPAVQVSVEDAYGNVVRGNTSSVTLALGNNPNNATLGGTLTVAAVNGVATFSDLSINKPGTGYTMTATDGSLSGATSSRFNVAAASTVQPTSTFGGAIIVPTVIVPTVIVPTVIVPMSASPFGNLGASSANDVALLSLLDANGSDNLLV